MSSAVTKSIHRANIAMMIQEQAAKKQKQRTPTYYCQVVVKYQDTNLHLTMSMLPHSKKVKREVHAMKPWTQAKSQQPYISGSIQYKFQLTSTRNIEADNTGQGSWAVDNLICQQMAHREPQRQQTSSEQLAASTSYTSSQTRWWKRRCTSKIRRSVWNIQG